jgi:two-component system sensor histidine kinase PilS (NtrC family)
MQPSIPSRAGGSPPERVLVDDSRPDDGHASLVRELVELHHFTENILRNMGSGLVAVNRHGVITHFNEQAARITGWAPSEAIGRPCGDILRTAAGGHDLLHEIRLLGNRDGEVDLLTRDGSHVPVSLRLTALAEDGTTMAGAVGIFTDLTDQRRAESELRRKERLASLGELSAGVAHEIRNPLAGIGAAAQLLRKRLETGDERTRFTDVILDEVGRLDRIVESLLKFARPAPPRLKPASVLDCARRALALVEEGAREGGVAVETSLAADIPQLYIDEDQIVQVLLNLLQNALQAMPDGGVLALSVGRTTRSPWVRRSAGRRAEDRARLPVPARPLEYVEVGIGDTGQGIPKAALERIFDPFFTTRREGTGLGLSISQAIMREHGGFLSIDSTPGRGTVASVHLPIEKRQGARRRD